jgi:hypothetical protein
MARVSLVTTGLLLASLFSGCRERNPAYVQKTEPRDGPPAHTDGKVEPPGDDAPSGDVSDAARDRRIVDEPILVGPEVGADRLPPTEAPLFVDDVRPEGPPHPDGAETGKPAEVGPEVAPEVLGPSDLAAEPGPEVGTSDVPVDVRDVALLDGDVGGDVGGGAVDVAPVCPEPKVRSCASPANPLIGACKAGQQTCSDGVWDPACKGEVLPAAKEACNGSDDNCNGLTDEGCTESCVVVAPGGSDVTGDGTAANPYATIAKALELAVAVDGGAPRPVCVAGGDSCQAEAVKYDLEASLVIPSGARVHGNYALANATLAYCAGTQPPTTTLRLKSPAVSVVFPDAAATPAELGGFTIERASLATSTGAAISAVAVTGARKVMLSGIFITDEPTGGTTYGVVVKGGGQATIVASAIHGGLGKLAAVGILVDGGSVTLRDNCDPAKLAGGVCQSSCAGDAAVLGIRGRSRDGAAEGESSAVYVTGQSTTGSTIAASLLCGGPGLGAGESLGAIVAALRCAGNGCEQVTGNAIAGGSGKLAVAVALANGGGRLEANAIASGCGGEGSTGVLLHTSAARLFNNRVVGSSCSAGVAAGSFYGVHVVQASGAGEMWLHSNDILPGGNGGECESRGVYMERVAGQAAPSGILRNNIVAAGDCKKRFAVFEESSAALRALENNDLYPQDTTTVLLHRAGNDALTIDKVNASTGAGGNGAAGNVSADPKFAAYPGDLHLTGESKACLDKGSAEGAPPTDADGVTRPQGAGYDIGAYEYVSRF